MRQKTMGFIISMIVVGGSFYLAKKGVITTDTQVIVIVLGWIIQAIYDKEE